MTKPPGAPGCSQPPAAARSTRAAAIAPSGRLPARTARRRRAGQCGPGRPGPGEAQHRGGDRDYLLPAPVPGGGNPAAGRGRAGQPGRGAAGGPQPRGGPGSRAPGFTAPGRDPGRNNWGPVTDAAGAAFCRAVSSRREPRREKSSRPDRPSDERSLDALLEGSPLPDGDLARWQPVSQVLTALTSVPASSELSRGGPGARGVPGPAAPRGGPGQGPAGCAGGAAPRHPAAPRGPAARAEAGGGGGGRRRADRRVSRGGLRRGPARPGPAAAHYTIGAPTAGQTSSAGLDPGRSSRLATMAGQASAGSGHGSPRTDRRTPRGSGSGSPRHQQASGSPSGTASGRPPGLWWPGHQARRPPRVGQPRPGQPSTGQSGTGQSGPVRQPQRFPYARADPAAVALGEPRPLGRCDPSPSATASTIGGSSAAPSA